MKLKVNTVKIEQREVFMKKGRTFMKIAIAFLVLILLLISVILLSFIVSSKNTIKPYLDEQGNILKGSVSEKIFIDVNGKKNGMIIRGKSENNPVLLFISGGPGVPQYWLNEYYDSALEDYFTVCLWDYYGEGLSYDSDIEKSEITLERLEKDAVTVTEYLKKRFSKEKVYLMAHSGGTPLGVMLAKDYPALYYCYFSMGQVVHHEYDRYTYGYRFMTDIFEKNGNKKAMQKMNSLVTVSQDGSVTPNAPDTIHAKWESVLLEAGCATTREMRSDARDIFFPQMNAKCYTFKEKINYWRGKGLCSNSPYHQFKIDSYEKINFEIPVYFFNGYYDYTCPTPMVETFYQNISAPDKDIYIFEDSAHSPWWEENDKMLSIMREKVKEESN